MRRIQEVGIGEALKRMKRGKAMGPDGIPIEVWRCLGDRAIIWLTKLFNLIFRSNKMPEEWRRSILVPIFKNKGDIQSQDAGKMEEKYISTYLQKQGRCSKLY